MDVIERKERDIIEGTLAIATSGGSIMEMSTEDTQLALLAIIAKRLGLIEGHEKAARDFGENIAALSVTIAPVPQPAECDVNALVKDAARYLWLRERLVMIQTDPTDDQFVMATFALAASGDLEDKAKLLDRSLDLVMVK